MPNKGKELGLELDLPVDVDENVIKALVSLFAKRAKLPEGSMNIHEVLQSEIKDEESIDTSAFEEEIR